MNPARIPGWCIRLSSACLWWNLLLTEEESWENVSVLDSESWQHFWSVKWGRATEFVPCVRAETHIAHSCHHKGPFAYFSFIVTAAFLMTHMWGRGMLWTIFTISREKVGRLWHSLCCIQDLKPFRQTVIANNYCEREQSGNDDVRNNEMQ